MSSGHQELFDSLAYIYDGSFEGLLTCIFETYARHQDPEDIVRDDLLQLRLGQTALAVETDAGKARRVLAGIERQAGYKPRKYLMRASACDDPAMGIHCLRFVRYVMEGTAGKALMDDITHPAMAPMVAYSRSVGQECEHMRQFIRFEHREGGVWFARCNPKADVVPFIMDHFVERFSIQPFVIYDEVHGTAGIYDGTRWTLADAHSLGTEPSVPPAAPDEPLMQAAWRCFYRSVSIPSRYNPELRRHFMPKRFWRNLTEMQEELPTAMVRS